MIDDPSSNVMTRRFAPSIVMLFVAFTVTGAFGATERVGAVEASGFEVDDGPAAAVWDDAGGVVGCADDAAGFDDVGLAGAGWFVVGLDAVGCDGLGLDVVGFAGVGFATAGTGALGAAPLPKRKPTAWPGFTVRLATPRFEYVHDPPRLAQKIAQYPVVGGITQGVADG